MSPDTADWAGPCTISETPRRHALEALRADPEYAEAKEFLPLLEREDAAN